MMSIAKYKIPISVLVVIHTPDLQVLLLERADWVDIERHDLTLGIATLFLARAA